jgi:hypothetical protein
MNFPCAPFGPPWPVEPASPDWQLDRRTLRTTSGASRLPAQHDGAGRRRRWRECRRQHRHQRPTEDADATVSPASPASEPPTHKPSVLAAREAPGPRHEVAVLVRFSMRRAPAAAGPNTLASVSTLQTGESCACTANRAGARGGLARRKAR